MLNRTKIFVTVLAFAVSLSAIGQDINDVTGGSEGIMRSEGKIYVVLVIVLTILAGLFLYVARLDKKISKLEKGDF